MGFMNTFSNDRSCKIMNNGKNVSLFLAVRSMEKYVCYHLFKT